MLLWELVLTADNRLDLSADGVALAWLTELSFVVPLVETGRGRAKRREPQPGCWTASHVTFFTHRLLALRSLAARLKGFKSRAPRADDWEADLLFRQYLGYVRVSAQRKPAPARRRSSAGPRPLDRDNFAGLKFAPEVPPEFAPDSFAPNVPAAQALVLRELELFFANAFTSLVITGLAPVCGRCGTKLKPTPTGRAPRAKFCKKCAFGAWQGGQSQEAKRERWKRDKQQQRGGNK